MVTYAPGTFYQLPNDIHRAVRSPYELAVLVRLIQSANANNEAWPSQQTLAQGIFSKKQVQRATTGLVNAGIITIRKEWSKQWNGQLGLKLVYTIHFEKLITVCETDSLLDGQSTRLSVPGLVDCQSPTTWTGSPSNHTNKNKTHKNKIKHPHGEFSNVFLTDEEYQKLTDRFGETPLKAQIVAISGWQKSKGKTYKDYYAAIIQWFAKDSKDAAKGGGNGRKSNSRPSIDLSPEGDLANEVSALRASAAKGE